MIKEKFEKDLNTWEEEIKEKSGKFEKEANRNYRHKDITFEIKNWTYKLNTDYT